MESKAEILERESDKLLDGVDALEQSFNLLKDNPLDTLVNEPQFFASRGFDCGPLVINCTLSLGALPLVTPPASKIKRSQYENIRDRLQNLISAFGGLQTNTNTVLNPATEPATKTSQLLIITGKIPGVLTDMAFMKLECEKIKKAREF